MLSFRLPLLITGVAGVAGFNAFHYFHARYPGRVIGIRPRNNWRLRGLGVIAQDAEDAAGMRRLFDEHGFRSVLNCVGNCALKSCEFDPAMARTVNVASAAVLADNVLRQGARLVHLSSDLVYSGKGSGNYVETDAVDPVTVYGKTMAEAEELFGMRVPAAALLRISLPMGPSFNHHAGAIDWIQSRFRAHRPATLYFDEVRSCTFCDDLNDAFEKFLANDEAGIFHAGGPRPITLYTIAQIVNRVGNYAPELLKGCMRLEAGPMPPRAGDVSMNSGKLVRALGYQPFRTWPVGDDVWPTHRRWHFERPADEPRSLQQIAQRLYRYARDVSLNAG
ncbi:MAG: sugar nucleotide-binding protein [Gemmataceae bacterium]|nr:sugar nucleotide-binding protein [Gemmataceae bacterium]MCI0738996.1 sugar nucleotide-binding protein [Gemmataceae bacterium]